MIDLDRRFEAATTELRDQLELFQPAPLSMLIERHRRRRVTIVLASAIAVVGLGGAIVTVARDVDAPDPVSDSVESPAGQRADDLLFPTEMIGSQPDEMMYGPQYGYGPRGLVRAPDGTLFVISLTERMSTELTEGAERRSINGRTYSVEQFDGETVYTSVDDCTALFIRQSHPTAQPFDANASALLDGLDVGGRHASLAFPDGWESFGVGRVGPLIQVAFHSTIGDGADQFNLMQLPDSKVSTLLGLAGAPLTQTSLNGQLAWTAASSEFTSLAWQDGANAAMLYSNTASLDQLVLVAGTLEHDRGDEYDQYDWTSGASLATSPVDTAATIPGESSPNTEACGSLELTFVD